jgi:hypothetical protein
MTTLLIIGLTILGIILLIGLIRVCITPFTTFGNFLMEMMLIDWLTDCIGWVIETIVDVID